LFLLVSGGDIVSSFGQWRDGVFVHVVGGHGNVSSRILTRLTVPHFLRQKEKRLRTNCAARRVGHPFHLNLSDSHASQNRPGPRSGVRRDAVGDHVTSTALQLTQGVKAKLGSLPDSPQSGGLAAEELLQGRDRRRSRLGREPCAAVGTFASCLKNSPVQD
jgi:hypothetical protein